MTQTIDISKVNFLGQNFDYEISKADSSSKINFVKLQHNHIMDGKHAMLFQPEN